jgi:hypothetical protein
MSEVQGNFQHTYRQNFMNLVKDHESSALEQFDIFDKFVKF